MQEWLKGLAATLFDEGIQTLAPPRNKCFNLKGDQVQT
jgi:hypothetical protein